MATCRKISGRNRQFCIGSLNQQITLQNRDIQPPIADSVDYSEEFTDILTVWANVRTVRGPTLFDQTNTEQRVTHIFGIRYVAGITSETWVEFDGNRYDIIDPEDFEESHDFIQLKTTLRGPVGVAINAV